ncbi:electron transfer flavoprotein subunit beta/FixA family protein [Candidatus Spongiihabitans sp.]|uniref:electron transfer flavoprotein subunit beta/FixA family protein n=1 Tax=Candidatus Spongiihabitans sp. TaxID=3101308 RepID=UPI003C6F19E9
MKILVPVKRVIDANIRVRVKADQTGVETANVKMAMNPFCEIAVEEALRLKEAGHAEEVIMVSAGPEKCQETIRTGLAMGADRGVHINTEATLEPLAIAKMIKAVAEKESADLIILGKQSIDDDNNQTGQMLAAIMQRPLGSYISKIEKNHGGFAITREIDAGLENLQITSPAVVTTDLRLNEPRYASLPNIMKAKKKPIDMVTPEQLGVDISNRIEVLQVTEPPARDAGVMVSSAAELVDKLKNEAKVI